MKKSNLDSLSNEDSENKMNQNNIETHDLLGQGVNSPFSGGYYNLEIQVLGWAQHTYVIADAPEDKQVSFPCYGGTDIDHQNDGSVYPADLYTPDYPPNSILGQKILGNLWLARAIACGDPVAAPRDNYDQKSGGTYLYGDCSGIVYAVNGVCHHMEARILYSCNNPVVAWPPSANASFWVWYDLFSGTGFYGNSWSQFKPIFDQWKGATSLLGATNISDLLRNSVKATLEQVEKPEYRAAVTKMVKSHIVAPQKGTLLTAIPDQMEIFLKYKNDLDKQLLKCTITKKEYAEKVDNEFGKTMTELGNVLNAGDYKTLFGISPGTEVHIGIDPEKIPDNFHELKLFK